MSPARPEIFSRNLCNFTTAADTTKFQTSAAFRTMYNWPVLDVQIVNMKHILRLQFCLQGPKSDRRHFAGKIRKATDGNLPARSEKRQTAICRQGPKSDKRQAKGRASDQFAGKNCVRQRGICFRLILDNF